MSKRGNREGKGGRRTGESGFVKSNDGLGYIDTLHAHLFLGTEGLDFLGGTSGYCWSFLVCDQTKLD